MARLNQEDGYPTPGVLARECGIESSGGAREKRYCVGQVVFHDAPPFEGTDFSETLIVAVLCGMSRMGVMRLVRPYWHGAKRGEKEHSPVRQAQGRQEWLCHENVWSKRRVLDFHGDDETLECS